MMWCCSSFSWFSFCFSQSQHSSMCCGEELWRRANKKHSTEFFIHVCVQTLHKCTQTIFQFRITESCCAAEPVHTGTLWLWASLAPSLLRAFSLLGIEGEKSSTKVWIWSAQPGRGFYRQTVRLGPLAAYFPPLAFCSISLRRGLSWVT